MVQRRTFRYDSLSRLTHQKQVEAEAKLDDTGAVVTSGGAWTHVFRYNSFSLLEDAVDARGTTTHLTYDTLNRVEEVSSTDGTPTVKYTYSEARTDAAGTSYFNQGQLTTLKTLATPANPDTGRPAVPETRQEYDYNRMG